MLRGRRLFSSLIFNSPHGKIEIPNKTVWQAVSEKADMFGDRTALICGLSGKTMSFREFKLGVQKTATSFTKHGMKKGDVIATNMINCFEYPILYHAATACGITLSPSSPQFNAVEMLRQLKSSQSTHLVTHAAVKESALDAAKEFGLDASNIWCSGTTGTSDSTEYRRFEDLLDVEEAAIKMPHVEIDVLKDVNLLPFSSGTTGAPKGVMLSHRNLLANTLQVDAIEKFDSAVLLMLPIFHIYPFLLMNLALYQGVPQVHLPRFEPDTLLNALESYKISKAHIVPPVAIFLAKHPMVDHYDLSATKILVSAAAPMGSEIEAQVKARLQCDVKQAYGMTEMSPCTHYATDSAMKPGSIGQLVPNTELRIVCTASGIDLPADATGELWARGPQNMLGYKDNEQATKETLLADGFLRTGDIGFVDSQGFAFIVDRLKELIKYKGHQVAPAELESVLLSHPKIADASCVRGTDSDGEEFPKAYVVLKDAADPLTEQEVMDFVAALVAPFKKVRGVSFIDAISKTPTGKILRRQLQQIEDAGERDHSRIFANSN